jgi:hypothetical protein
VWVGLGPAVGVLVRGTGADWGVGWKAWSRMWLEVWAWEQGHASKDVETWGKQGAFGGERGGVRERFWVATWARVPSSAGVRVEACGWKRGCE